jgi:hypothetical protein
MLRGSKLHAIHQSIDFHRLIFCFLAIIAMSCGGARSNVEQAQIAGKCYEWRSGNCQKTWRAPGGITPDAP